MKVYTLFIINEITPMRKKMRKKFFLTVITDITTKNHLISLNYRLAIEVIGCFFLKRLIYN